MMHGVERILLILSGVKTGLKKIRFIDFLDPETIGFEHFSIGNPPDHYQNSPSDLEFSEIDQISNEDISELKRS